MKIQIQENEIDIINLGTAVENHGVVKREVTFEINGKPFQRTIVLGLNGTGADYEDPEKFI